MKIFNELQDMSFFNDMIIKDKPFIFARYRDGECLAMFRPDATKGNCDGHKFFPDMGERLRESLIWLNDHKDKLNVYVNLCYGKEEMKQPVHDFLAEHNIDLRWTIGAKILDNSFLNEDGSPGSMADFFDLIRDKQNTVLVGNSDLSSFNYSMGFNVMVDIPKVDSWLDYNKILERCINVIIVNNHFDIKNTTFLFCAGMMTEVLIRDLAERYPDNTYIDIGCIFDFVAGLKNRGYMTDDYYNKVIKHYKKYTVKESAK